MKVALVFLAALAFAAAMPLAEFDLSPEEESLLEQIAADPSLVELFTDPVVVQVMTEMAADHIQKEADGQDGQDRFLLLGLLAFQACASNAGLGR